MNTKVCYLIVLSFSLLLLLLATPTTARAQFRQEQYYDWSSSDRRTPTVLGLTARAQEETTATQQQASPGGETAVITTDLAPAGTTPGNPLYFFETAFEGIQETLTFNPEAKAELKLQHAEERLSEANALIDSGAIQAGTQHLKVYEDKLADATSDLTALKNQGTDVTSLAETVEQATARHTTVLEEVALKVPEQAAPGIQTAILASQTGMDRAADVKGEPPIPVDLLARMNALRGQGILSEEESSSLVNATSREEARKLFKGFVDQGVLPEADFKRFDTAQAKYLPEQFVKHVEISKFNELRRLEDEAPPPDNVKAQLQQFAGTFKPGDIVPPEIRRYWAQTVRLEEVQKTIRPDYIDPQLFAGRQEEFGKLQELQNRVRPTNQEAALAEQYLKDNPDQPVPPQIQRILDLKERLGTLQPGFIPPPGHKESTFLPDSVLKYTGEIPYNQYAPSFGQTGTSGPSGPNQGTGQPDYSKYFQGQTNFIGPLPPTFTTSGGAQPQTGQTQPGGTGTYSPSSTGSTGEFRTPYYPPQPTGSGTGTYQQPSSGSYQAPTGSYQPPSSGTTSQPAPAPAPTESAPAPAPAPSEPAPAPAPAPSY